MSKEINGAFHELVRITATCNQDCEKCDLFLRQPVLLITVDEDGHPSVKSNNPAHGICDLILQLLE